MCSGSRSSRRGGTAAVESSAADGGATMGVSYKSRF